LFLFFTTGTKPAFFLFPPVRSLISFPHVFPNGYCKVHSKQGRSGHLFREIMEVFDFVIDNLIDLTPPDAEPVLPMSKCWTFCLALSQG
jgi:hypothetical protein